MNEKVHTFIVSNLFEASDGTSTLSAEDEEEFPPPPSELFDVVQAGSGSEAAKKIVSFCYLFIILNFCHVLLSLSVP